MVLIATAVLTLRLIGVRSWRARSITNGVLGKIVWQVYAIALVRGFLARPTDPRRPVDIIVVRKVRPKAVPTS